MPTVTAMPMPTAAMGGFANIFADHDVDGSADGMASAIAGYGGGGWSDDDASSTRPGAAMPPRPTATPAMAVRRRQAATASGSANGGDATVGGVNLGDAIGGYGGTATSGDGGAGGSVGNWGSNNGDDGYVTGESYASAAAVIDVSAFNQNIVMGAERAGNTVDMTVVGGSPHSTVIGDDDLG